MHTNRSEVITSRTKCVKIVCEKSKRHFTYYRKHRHRIHFDVKYVLLTTVTNHKRAPTRKFVHTKMRHFRSSFQFFCESSNVIQFPRSQRKKKKKTRPRLGNDHCTYPRSRVRWWHTLELNLEASSK